MNPEAGLSGRISQRIARLNIFRIALPTRLAWIGVLETNGRDKNFKFRVKFGTGTEIRGGCQ